MDKAILILHLNKAGKEIDIEVPLHISAKELVIALNEAYDLKIDTEDISKCYLKCENPIALLKGDKTLKEYGLHNGSEIRYGDTPRHEAVLEEECPHSLRGS